MHDEDAEVDAENTLRILVATDIHVGYKERASVRGDDSFLALEEVLATAKETKVRKCALPPASHASIRYGLVMYMIML